MTKNWILLIIAVAYGTLRIAPGCSARQDCAYDIDCPSSLICHRGTCQIRWADEPCLSSSCQGADPTADGGSTPEENPSSSDGSENPQGPGDGGDILADGGAIDAGSDQGCIPRCANRCCGGNGCGGNCPNRCRSPSSCGYRSGGWCECVDQLGYVEKIINGDFSQQMSGWEIQPEDGSGTVFISNNSIFLQVFQDAHDGIAVHQVIDLTGLSYSEVVFFAMVDPQLITDSTALGIGILLDAYKTSAMRPQDRMFIQFNQSGVAGPSVISVPWPEGYPVFDLWLVVDAGPSSAGAFNEVSFKVLP